jgi:Ca2+:H+ antiporter
MSDGAAASGGQFRPMEKLILLITLLLSAGVIALKLLGVGDVGIFTLSAIALMLLAWVLGHATEQLGAHVGGRIAGILNATLGNLPELVIVLLLIRAATPHNDLIDVAKASILGSVLGNVLFVMGAAFLVGGLRHGTQRFKSTFASLHGTMLLIAVAAISVPTLIHARPNTEAAHHIGGISIAAAVILLVVYIASLRFFLTDTEHSAEDEEPAHWSKWTSLAVLAGSAVGVGIVSEALVKSMEHTIQEVGISASFMGFILVPIVGNIAEHLVAVQLAARDDVDFSITIALGSSVQVALGLAPIALLASHLMATPLDFVFDPLQLLSLVLAALIVPTVVNDGESTWIEGLMLLSVYVLIAVGFWF